eukprot:TRINITY_DN111524_c0_g1_i1.p1 TRINITY_DN111524_c0_g1~~TRINITY_DN111524_c0_g1_i1.p1  ORF type:complete len:312 (-),score=67.15 TRINITY_DN111524_c0_g1_i1:57-944(-)
MASASVRVAFVGLGQMGWHMAQRLQEKFPTVLVRSGSESKALRHASQFGTEPLVAWSRLQEVDVIVTCLPTSSEVKEVLEQAEPHLQQGSLVVDCTSGDPDVTLALGRRLQQRGVALVDAPLSGGPRGAEAGMLSVMVGGSEVDVDRCQPIFEPLAATVEHVGDLSAGHAIKAVNNGLATVSLLAAGEGLAALKARGIDLSRALAAINASSGQSWVTKELYPKRVLPRTFDHGFALRLMQKDAAIAARMAVDADAGRSLLKAAEAGMAKAVSAYGADGDLSEAAKLYEAAGFKIE